MARIIVEMVSFNKEQACGGENPNIVTVVMVRNKVDIQGAVEWTNQYHTEVQARFMDTYESKIPKFGERGKHGACAVCRLDR
jgi:hypothetical protein